MRKAYHQDLGVEGGERILIKVGVIVRSPHPPWTWAGSVGEGWGKSIPPLTLTPTTATPHIEGSARGGGVRGVVGDAVEIGFHSGLLPVR